MSWKSLAPYKLARSDGGLTVAVQARALTVRIGPLIVSQTGWTPGERLDVQIGADDDHGWARLVRDASGWSLLAQGRKQTGAGYTILRINKVLAREHGVPEMPEHLKMTPVAATVRDGAVSFLWPWLAVNAVRKTPGNGTQFEKHNVVTRDGGARKLNRPPTHVGRATTLGGD